LIFIFKKRQVYDCRFFYVQSHIKSVRIFTKVYLHNLKGKLVYRFGKRWCVS